MKTAKNVGKLLWTVSLLLTLTALGFSAVSHEDIARIKGMVEAGETLTQSDLLLAKEINATTGSYINLNQALGRSRVQAEVDRGRGRGSLDEYIWENGTYQWVDITTNGTSISQCDDCLQGPINLGFTFGYYDNNYTSIGICSNGWITFSNYQFGDLAGPEIPDPIEPNAIIAAFWDDMLPTGGQCRYFADAANQRFIISWDNCPHFGSGEQYTFQIILYATGNIKMQYNSIPITNSTQLGIENADGTEGIQLWYDGAGVFAPNNNTAVLISQPDGVPNAPTNLTAQVTGHTVTLNWVNPTQDTNGNPITPTNYQVWLGPVGSGTLLATVNHPLHGYVHNNAPDGNDTYNVRAFLAPHHGPAVTTTVLVGNPSYSENFETDEGLWVSDGGWEWGTPTDGPTPHSGTHCWGTILDGNYEDDACYTMTLAPELAIISPTATVEFWYWSQIEGFWDGTTFKISIDGGNTWEVVEPEEGYNQQGANNDCINQDGCWSLQNDWLHTTLNIGQWNGEVPQFRFVFGSDFSVTLPGFYFDDMIIWGLQPPVGAPVSGTVTLDGGAGNITQATVRANGLGSPSTNPNGSGNYTLQNVLVGQRTVRAELAGYATSFVPVTVVEGGVTGVNLTIRRLPPPIPTNLTATVNSESGVVSLDWDNSTDPLVDNYRVYRKIAGDTAYALVQTYVPSNGTDQLTAPGIYDYVVAAVDVNVSVPVVSGRSNRVQVLYGELPPSGLSANGNFDNKIRLNWLEPGSHPAYNIFYDDSSSEAWFRVAFPNGNEDYFAVRFTSPPPDSVAYPLALQEANVFMETDAPIPNVWVTPDLNGAPDLDNPLAHWTDISADGSPGWIHGMINGEVFIDEPSDFWMVIQFPPGQTSPGCGSDQNAPDARSYWTWENTPGVWNQWFAHDWMMRMWVGGPREGGFVLSSGTPSGYRADALPRGTAAPSYYNSETGEISQHAGPTRQVAQNRAEKNPWSELHYSAPVLNTSETPYVLAPALVFDSREEGGRSLDEVIHYNVYRDGLEIAEPVPTNYEDFNVIEGQVYAYYVTATYDNNEESGQTGTVLRAANMAPAAPGNINGTTLNSTTIRISWTDPTLNANGTPCVDLMGLRVYRDNTLIGTVAPGVLHFDDVPPQPNVQYEWKVRGIDEVPNEGPIASFAGSVVNPWQEETMEWEDITDTGTQILQCFFCIEGPFDLGFNFTYYGNTYSEVYICSNGYLTFSAGQVASGGGPVIPDPSSPNNILAGLWTGFNTFNGNCRYYEDTANDRFIVSWDECPDFNGFGNYTFQIILESNGRITFQYATIPNSTFHQVGIENAAGTLGISLWANGTGDFQPTNGSAVSFFGPPPVYVPVSGTVTLDGGTGNVTQVDVVANGVNHPLAHPLANGTYSMPEVVAGNRRFIASLANYIPDTNRVAVPEGGLINNNFTLRRVNPPAPANLTGSVNSGTGLVTLDWNNSTDPLVDVYRIYRRLQGDQNWVLVGTVTPSNGTHQLTADGVYQFAVTAVDNNASTPVESNRSNSIEVLYGEIPPTNLVANGDFDNQIRLTWLSPGSHPTFNLFYDDSSSEAWFRVAFPNGAHDYFAVRFTPPSEDSASYPLQIQTVNVFMETDAQIPNVWITPDLNGGPDLDGAYRNWTDIAADGAPGWINAEANGEQMLETADDFWVVIQFPPGQNAPGCGSDQSAPDGRSYWTWDNTPGTWNQWFAHDWMMRVWLGGPHDQGFVLSSGTPQGYQVERVPNLAVHQNNGNKPQGASSNSNQKFAGPVRSASKQSKFTTETSSTLSTAYRSFADYEKLTPYVQAPALEYNDRGSSDRGRGALDELLYYIVFHNGTDVAHPTETNYNYAVPSENVDHTFYVKAHYDNNEDSPPSNTVVERANMAPGAPTNVALQAQGQNSMRISWSDPTLNANGTPCVDLAGLRVYRDNTFLSNVAVGVHQYVDTPPDNQTRYTWSVRGVDEVPNIGPAGSANGAVVSPWETTDYEWVDISGIGTNTGLNGDDQNTGPFPLGFQFNFYGQNYTSVYVCSNGWISFTSQSAVYFEQPIPDPNEPNAVCYGLWDDLYLPNGGSIVYYADAANDRFIVSWLNVPHIDGNGNYTFQIILDESGSVTYNYQALANVGSDLIGVENADGSLAEQVWFDGTGDFTPTNNSAVVFWGGPAGELAGTVRVHSSNTLLPDVRVWAQGWTDTVLTDAQGNYFMELDPGTYAVHFEKQGFCDTVFTNIVVEDGNTTVRNARMLAPTAAFNITSINESSWPGHDILVPINITNQTGNCPLEFNITDPVNWITYNPVSGSVNPGQTVVVNVAILASLLGPGEHQTQITITNGSLNSPYVIPVTLFMAVDADDPNAPLPTEFALHQNYPNPFNATTAIRFDLPKESRVSLKIFNLMGQEVATPLNDNLPAGRHEISYTASDLPSGMYMIRMEAENFTALNKMVLLK